MNYDKVPLLDDYVTAQPNVSYNVLVLDRMPTFIRHGQVWNTKGVVVAVKVMVVVVVVMIVVNVHDWHENYIKRHLQQTHNVQRHIYNWV